MDKTKLDTIKSLKEVGKITLSIVGSNNTSGEATLRLWVWHKRDDVFGMSDNIFFVERYLNSLGFTDIHSGSGDPNDEIVKKSKTFLLAFANINAECIIGEKTCTITHAKAEDMENLQMLMKHTRIKIEKTCNEPRTEPLSMKEFKQAVTNYLKQHQK